MITPSFPLTATERVLPRLALDFTTASLDARITFTRTGATATVINSNGFVESVAADTARFDFDPVSLACKGLLIEETRTNTIVYSSDLSQANWTKQLSTVSLDNAVNSPANVSGVYKLIPNNGSAGHLRYSYTTANSTSYAISFFAKKAEYDWVSFGRAGAAVWFDLTNGVVGTVSAGYSNATIQELPNGWYRCTLVYAETTGASTTWRIYPASSNGTIATGNGTNGLYVWGVQVEVAAFPTSYIPTTTTAMTRNADVATMTGTNFSDWFNASEGTLQVEYYKNSGTSTNARAVTFGPLAAGSFATISSYGANKTGWYASGLTGLATATDNSINKQCIAYTNGGVFAGSTNASTVISSASSDFTGVGSDALWLGTQSTGVNYLNGYLRKINYWPQRITNAEVQAFSK